MNITNYIKHLKSGIQHYKIRIKDKVEQSRKKSSAPLHLGVVTNEKEAFGSPSTMVANFTSLLYL